jgi:mRNA-degrading endonuclease RelE of RelBE toxin-antitoxin system
VAGALQIWAHVFCRCFDRLPPDVRAAVTAKIDDMGTRISSFPHERLKGRDEYKLRVGDFRVLDQFDAASGRVHLLYVGHRREIYKRT